MDFYFAGAEQPVYLKHLISYGVDHVAISYYEWANRHSQDEVYKHIPPDMNVCITAGVARKAAINWDSFSKDYIEFCERNADRCLIYDMDAPECPPEIRRSTRSVLQMLSNTVMFPLEGETLEAVAYDNERVGVNSRVAKSRPVNELRRLQASLYGSNITDPAVLRPGRFIATTSLAWLGARRFGELWIFTRGQLRHYTADKLTKAVRAHAGDIEAFGVDPLACLSNDKGALTEVAVRSLQVMADNLTGRPRDRSQGNTAGASSGGATPDGEDEGSRLPVATGKIFDAVDPNQRERVLLPVVTVNGQGNALKVSSNPDSLRQCDSCFMSSVCPKYVAGSGCAFTLPVEFKTDDQWEAACQTLLEIQFGRIQFANMAEQLDGGGLTPSLGREMDRFMKILTQLKELKAPIPSPEDSPLAQIFGGIKAPTSMEVENAVEVEGEEDYEEEPSR